MPWAVIGRWRWVTTPPTITFERGAQSHNPWAVTTPRRSRSARTKRVGCPSGATPVAHRSAADRSTGSIPGRVGASTPVTIPGSRPGRDWATAPTAHSASRRPRPKHCSKAPAVAIASSCCRCNDGLRRTRSSGDTYGPCSSRPATIAAASSSPIVRIDPSPRRTACPPVDIVHGSSVAIASEASRSGPSVVTPWRRASLTSECGDQKPIGWALISAAQNAAG